MELPLVWVQTVGLQRGTGSTSQLPHALQLYSPVALVLSKEKSGSQVVAQGAERDVRSPHTTEEDSCAPAR